MTTQTIQEFDSSFDFLPDAGVHTFAEIVARDADTQTFHRFCDFVGVNRHRCSGRSRIVGIASGNGLQNSGNVFHIVGERADAIERGSKSDQTVARYAAVAAHHRRDPAERAGLADRAAGIGSQRGNS